VGAANGVFEGRRPRSGLTTDAFGLPVSYRHRLALSAGFGQADFGAGLQRTENELGADLFLDSTPGFGHPTHGWRPSSLGMLTFLQGGAALGDGRLVSAEVAGKVSVAGATFRDVEATFEPKPRGQSVFLGLATGFEYWERTPPTLSNDRLAIVRLLGPMVDAAVVRGDFTLHVEGDAAWDFAMVHPFGGDSYIATASPGELPSVVQHEDYYFAQGLSLGARVLGTYGPWESGVDVGEDDFRPVGVLDRNGAPAPPSTGDRRARRRLWLGVRPLRSWPLAATVAGDQIVRSGHMADMSAGSSELRASTALSLIF